MQDYGMVEEFISTVSDIVPELLNADQKAQLLLGLRARVRLQCLCGFTCDDFMKEHDDSSFCFLSGESLPVITKIS